MKGWRSGFPRLLLWRGRLRGRSVGDIHQGLIAAGRIKEPLLGMNSFESHWTQDRSWWFRKRFATVKEWLTADAVELELNGLDSNASIFVNGVHVGDHGNAFYPFVKDIKKHLVAEGENILLVRLTAGVENVTQEQVDKMGHWAATEVYNGRKERGDHRRFVVRKPQYSFGWDWSPRVPTTAIGGDVIIRSLNKACIREVYARSERQGKDVFFDVRVTADFLHGYASGEGMLAVTLVDPKGKRSRSSGAFSCDRERTFIRSKFW